MSYWPFSPHRPRATVGQKRSFTSLRGHIGQLNSGAPSRAGDLDGANCKLLELRRRRTAISNVQGHRRAGSSFRFGGRDADVERTYRRSDSGCAEGFSRWIRPAGVAVLQEHFEPLELRGRPQVLRRWSGRTHGTNVAVDGGSLRFARASQRSSLAADVRAECKHSGSARTISRCWMGKRGVARHWSNVVGAASELRLAPSGM